jgi:MoxR-like ATPase
MEERQVTIDRTGYALPEAFTVFATQNPIDFEGTYPLPEAQLDRFLMKLRLSYPSTEEERVVLQRHHASIGPKGLESTSLTPVEVGLLAAAQAEVRGVRIEASLYDYILAVVRRTREWPSLTLGASPRAAVSLMLVAQGFAALEGRNYLIPDDVKQAALPVLRHRLILKPEAELEGYDTDRVMTEILAAVAVPKQ